jgi:hypothetical protein
MWVVAKAYGTLLLLYGIYECPSLHECPGPIWHSLTHEGRGEPDLHTEATQEIVMDRLKAGSPVKAVLDGVLLTLQQHEHM